MKKIIISLSVIAAVAAAVVGITTAYFSDTETSTGNTFTAGELDLIVDIDGVDQNPLTQKLFDLDDMKPGDDGEVTLSLKVADNPACGIVEINMYDDLDNNCNEPEGKDEMMGQTDNGPVPGCDDVGELNDAINWMIWADVSDIDNADPCDNIWQKEELILTTGTLTGGKSYAIGELPIAPDKICYGVAYCFGNWVNGVCDGSQVNNISQSDSFKGDITFTAKQKRNQFDGPNYPNGCPVGEIRLNGLAD